MKSIEVNFDGLVGPTHNYAGIAKGNLASETHALQISNPKAAALQGLKKMKLLMDLGIPQAILPPHERPFIPLFHRLGFVGSLETVLKNVKHVSPDIFKAAYSASSVWTANAATVSPSADTFDKRVHLTPANLISHLHRSLEAETTYTILNKIFKDEKYFTLHKPLPSNLLFSDEGAANHSRICKEYGEQGLALFVYGKDAAITTTLKYPARQTLEASMAVARLQKLDPTRTLFVKQNPTAIDKGVFHNDVIFVANKNVLFYHEEAFIEMDEVIEKIKEKIDFPLILLPIFESEVTLTEAVKTYLFNSQLVSTKEGMALIAPIESKEYTKTHAVLLRMLDENNPIKSLYFVDCRESMKNGGGPACLRLRVVLTEEELKACHPGVFLDEKLHQRLIMWVNQHYRDRITEKELLDPQLVIESQTTLEELTIILKLGSIYHFQKE